MPSRFNVLSESSVWTEFSSLGRETGAYNLGQVKSLTSPSCGICGSPVVIFSMLFVYFISVIVSVKSMVVLCVMLWCLVP